MSNGKRRRLYLVLLGMCLLLIVLIGGQMWMSLTLNRQSVVSYGVIEVAPLEPRGCIGGKIQFPVTVIVSNANLPTQIEIAESWCKIGLAGACFGVQPSGMEPQAKRLPLLREKRIETLATRNVPANLTPGIWEFWHSSADTKGNVEAYIVGPVELVQCE